jgi:DUF971 family protein
VTAVRAQPVSIDIEREAGLTITWDDGRTTNHDLTSLRVSCPCAECRGLRDRGAEVWPKPGDPVPVEVTAADTVGAWGLSLTWNDGHTTGIYTWDQLQAWA